MTLTFFSNILNHHQVAVADELYALLGDDFKFVATMPIDVNELKGGADYSDRPYCIMAAESPKSHQRAMRLAEKSDVCLFAACSLDFAVARAKSSNLGLSFESGERWLKRGWINVLSPTLRRWWINYMKYFRHKDFYKLCCSGFTASDDIRLGAYHGRHYKWGYFTSVPALIDEKHFESSLNHSKVRILWIARFLSLKHPELALKMANALKINGYDFVLDFYGSGPEEERIKGEAESMGLNDVVRFHGNISNERVYDVMRNSDIFLFTSDKHEGWGAVANEAMANACVLVASDAIGSTPYLVKDGYNGFIFKSRDSDSLTEKVKWLLDNPTAIAKTKRNAYITMQSLWNPSNAAQSLLQLIDDLQNGRESSMKEGPCSKA